MQEANAKGTTDSPHVQVQLLTAELERVKSELKLARQEKKAAEAPWYIHVAPLFLVLTSFRKW